MAGGKSARWKEVLAEMETILRNLTEARLHHTILMILALMVVGGTVVWLIEGVETFATPFDALWWAIVTMTTVGYGDITPHRIPGKLATMVIILCGVAMVSMFTARISSLFVTSKIREGKGLQEVRYKNHLILAGWHSGSEKLVDSLLALSVDNLRLVLVNNLLAGDVEVLLDRFKAFKPKFVRGDICHEAVLRRAGAKNAWAVILLPEMHEGATSSQVDQRTILAALTAKEINSKIRVFAYALEAESVPHMRRGGVDQVVTRDSHTAYLLACHAFAPGIPEVIDELLSVGGGHRIERVAIPKHLIDGPVSGVELWARKRLNGLLIGLVTEQRVLETADILSDDLSSINAFIKRKLEEVGRSADELAKTRIEINPDRSRLITDDDVAVVIRREAANS